MPHRGRHHEEIFSHPGRFLCISAGKSSKLRAFPITGKAIIALASKFLRVIYKTLKHNWVFEDFPRFVLADG
jgi:hypothetical protein